METRKRAGKICEDANEAFLSSRRRAVFRFSDRPSRSISPDTRQRKLFRVVERYRHSPGGYYTCVAGQTIGLEAEERNRLIKMLIARLVRRPPAMSARSSAGVASRGVHEYLPLNFRSFSRFSFPSSLLFFPCLLSPDYLSLDGSHTRPCARKLDYMLPARLDRREP